ncbi:MAG: FtsK/SpoIIIE domain-containing protein [Verrucomicrobiota bacterium]
MRVSRTLELLNRLKQTTAAFAKKEERLSRDLGVRRFAINRAHHEALATLDAECATQTQEAQTLFDARKQHVTAVYESRRERLVKICNASIRDLPSLARQAKEVWMGDLQMRDFQAQGERTANLAAADAAYGESARQLGLQQAALAALEHRVRRAFFGYWSFQKMLRAADAAESFANATDGSSLRLDLQSALLDVEKQLGAFRQFYPPLLFSYAPLPVVLLLALLAAAILYPSFGWGSLLLGLALTGMALLFHHKGWNQSQQTAKALSETFSKAQMLHAACEKIAQADYQQARNDIQQEYEKIHAELSRQWSRADTIEKEFEAAKLAKLNTQAPRAEAKNEAIYHRKFDQIEAERAARLEAVQHAFLTQQQQLAATHDAAMAQWIVDERNDWAELQACWQREITPLRQTLEKLNATATTWFPDWTPELVGAWTPPTTFLPAAQFARFTLDLTAQPEGIPKDPRLALPGSPQISAPLALCFPTEGSLLFETGGSGDESIVGTLNNIILRLLSTTPPGKISFTIIDPVGLGENFAGLMQLSDYEESLINRRIWTQRDQIEERLAELCEHIEKVIQMYLRNQYATITEYNEQAGSVAEKYHFLVVADFPAAFSETAAARLQSIANSGARCGVFTLLHWDKRQSLPDGFAPDELRANSVRIRQENGQLLIHSEKPEPSAQLLLDAPPNPELAVELAHKIGKSSIDSNRVEVPFAQIAPAPEEMWHNDTTNELRIAIGRTGATKHQFLAIGKGTRQHALFAGKTGSGKSTLFHVIITNLALACSPEQVEFYLIDFKKGVEFKCYAEKRLPHAKVVAIESDREFALSVLERVDEELKRRGDLFRKLGVQDIAGYKRAGGTEAIPRTLLIIDEFQEFFVDDDAIAQTASLLFDRIVRQGRAFGIHVLLGSQTLGGAYSLARATLGQMVIRVALQCNEADAYLIMDDSNPAPRLLSRPGEGIYNDAAGALEGNSPFQVVWLPDDERDQWLDKVHDLAEQHPGQYGSPIVFEGNAPADIRDNALLAARLATKPVTPPPLARAWLGAPNSIKGPTEAAFQRQSGSNLLIVGQRGEVALTLLGVSMLALATQYPAGTAKFVLFHTATPGTPDGDFIENILQAIPHPVTVARTPDVAEVMSQIATDLKSRSGGEEAEPPIFCFIHDLQKFKKLRHEDDFAFSMSDSEPNPGAQFTDVITEGASHGIHLIVTLDTFNNVNRFLSRKALSEFGMRVVFQMSANDSASLVDSPKANTLGLHRALFYSEHEGTLETFRPYATPDAEWLLQAGEKIR